MYNRKKVLLPILVKLEGKVIETKDVHSSKTESLIVLKLSEKVTFVSFEQFQNIPSGILVALLLIVAVVKLVHPANIPFWYQFSPSSVTVAGIVTLLKDVQSERKTMDMILHHLKTDNHPVNHWYYGHFHQSWHSAIEGILYQMLDIMEFSQVY